MDSDSDLQALRAKRLAEMQEGYGGGNKEKAAEEQKRVEEMRNGILSRILDQDARARLNNIVVAKPEKGKMIETILIQMAQRGQISGRMDEEDLKGILEQVNSQVQEKKVTVKFDRRRAALDSDEELDV